MATFDELERSRHDGSRFEIYKFETEDNRYEWFFTTGETKFVFGSETYEPEPIQRSEVQQASGEGSGQRLTITVPYTNPVAAIHVPYLPPRPVLVTIYAVQRRATGIDVVQCFVGYIVSFSQKGPIVELQCSHIIDGQQQRTPWVVHKAGCVWSVYGVGCGVLQAPYESLLQKGNYTIAGDMMTSPLFTAQSLIDPTWFRAGKIFNARTGEMRFITEHFGGTIRLRYPFHMTNPADDDLIVVAGCDLSRHTCQLKFNNKKNYLGFDHQPNYNVFDGGVR